MKKLLILAFTLVALVSCKKEEIKPELNKKEIKSQFDKVKIM